MKRQRKPRPTPADELPLDDGRREGPEAWKELGGVRFCHWDRWFLRLALTEPQGLASIEAEFRGRVRARRGRDEVSEALLAQLVDLRVRLASVAATPEALLDAEERASKWLERKAFRRVWHASTIRHTEAMERTPRRVLEQRALTGNWLAFPVSPAPYYAQLRDTVGDGDYDYSGTSAVVVLLEVAGGALLAGSRTELERLAIHRAMLTVCIGAMEQVDDSLADLAEHFREQERAYLELLRAHADAPGLLRDLLELAIWENYGLFEGVEDFLSTLPGAERERELAQRELDAIEGELRAAELDAQLRRARALQRVLRTPHPVDAGAPPGSPAIASVGFVSSWRRRT